MYLNKLVSYVTGYTQNKIFYYMDRKKFALSDVNNIFNYGWHKKEIKYTWSRLYYWAQNEMQFWHREEKSVENWNCFELHGWKHSVGNIFDFMYCPRICFLISCSVFFVMYISLIFWRCHKFILLSTICMCEL